MPTREIKLKSDKEQIFEHFSEGAQPPRSSFQGWLVPPSPHVVGAYVHIYVKIVFRNSILGCNSFLNFSSPDNNNDCIISIQVLP